MTDDSLSEAFWRVARRLRSATRETLAPWDILPSHSRALVVLLRFDTLRLSELSDHLHIAPRSTTEVVDGLQEKGFVVRTPDPHDRRATLVSLTDAGRQVTQDIGAARLAESNQIFGELSESDRTALARILRKLS